MLVINPQTMEQILGQGLDHSRNEEVWRGGALWYAHRVDLHGGLLGLVLDTNDDDDEDEIDEVGDDDDGNEKEEVNGVDGMDGMDGKGRKGRKGWVRIEGGKEVVAYVSTLLPLSNR